jgi:hypothetical protein
MPRLKIYIKRRPQRIATEVSAIFPVNQDESRPSSVIQRIKVSTYNNHNETVGIFHVSNLITVFKSVVHEMVRTSYMYVRLCNII